MVRITKQPSQLYGFHHEYAMDSPSCCIRCLATRRMMDEAIRSMASCLYVYLIRYMAETPDKLNAMRGLTPTPNISKSPSQETTTIWKKARREVGKKAPAKQSSHVPHALCERRLPSIPQAMTVALSFFPSCAPSHLPRIPLGLKLVAPSPCSQLTTPAHLQLPTTYNNGRSYAQKKSRGGRGGGASIAS